MIINFIFITPMKLSKEAGKEIRKFPAACRSAVVILLELGFDIDEIKNNLSKFAELEANLYDRWYRKMIHAIHDWRIDPETYAYELARRLDEKSISPEHAVTLVNRRLQQLKDSGHRPSRMLEQIKKNAAQYTAECRKFQKYAIPYITDLNYEGLYKRVGEHAAEIRRVEEDKLFQLQTIHHLHNKQADCMDLSLPRVDRCFPEDLLPRALSTAFSADDKIAHEQALLINGFFDSEGSMAFELENPMVVKQLCFRYIADVLANRIPNIILIQVSFKGDWVSKEIHDIYMEAYENIRKYGMTVVVHTQVKKLYDRFALEGKKKSELMPFERWVAELEEKYRAY